MELDFGPVEPPSQPPNNLPPPLTPPPKPPTPTPESAPAPAQGAPVAHAQSVPVKPKRGGRTMLLVAGVIIIVLGLGYLGYTFFAQSQPGSDIASLSTDTVAPTTTTIPELATRPTATTTQDTASTPAAAAPTAVETLQTRDLIRKKDLTTIQTYLQSYFNDRGSYPISAALTRLNDSTSSVVTSLVPKYTSALPLDRSDPEFFYGYKSVDGKTYTLTARLENTADPEGKQEGALYIYSVSK